MSCVIKEPKIVGWWFENIDKVCPLTGRAESVRSIEILSHFIGYIHGNFGLSFIHRIGSSLYHLIRHNVCSAPSSHPNRSRRSPRHVPDVRRVSARQEIPFRHVWSSTCPLLHCSFSLEHVGRSGNSAARTEGSLAFSARVLVCQKGGTQTRRQMLRVSSAESGQIASPLPGRPTATLASSVSTSASGSSAASATSTVTTLDSAGGHR